MTDKSTIVVGAGMVGLATAWHLQDRGFDVTVVDRGNVAAGSSWGNAGWLSPALVLPLNDPSTMAAGIRAILKSNSPVYVPPTANPRLLAFLASFARQSTPARWRRSLSALASLSCDALEAYDQLAAANPELATTPAQPLLAAFASQESRSAITHEFAALAELGQAVDYTLLEKDDLRSSAPYLGTDLNCGIALRGQRFIDPGEFVRTLADDITARGGQVLPGAEVVSIDSGISGVEAQLSSRRKIAAESIVLANGAWLPKLARGFGVRLGIQAGRGYSFSVPRPHAMSNPIYLPEARVACTPLANGRLRVAGMMEFRAPDAALDRRRIQAIEGAVLSMLPNIDWTEKDDEWVGSRPCTADGLPALGRTRDKRVFVAGGHGMWGVALGPLSGRLVAEVVAGERDPATLGPFDPLR